MVDANLAPTRSKSQGMIMAGEVQVNGKTVTKAGTKVDETDVISVKNKPRFVGRGGEKLEKALSTFGLTLDGVVCADVGACTGGFTDCLLQHDASKVYAIDVGYGQLDYRLRVDDRVVVMERTNARYLESLDEQVELVVIDVSFISLSLIIPAAKMWLAEKGNIVALVKPQFEASRSDVGKGGVVRDRAVHQTVLHKVVRLANELSLSVNGIELSPIKGADGNREFLLWLATYPEQKLSSEEIEFQIVRLTQAETD